MSLMCVTRGSAGMTYQLRCCRKALLFVPLGQVGSDLCLVADRLEVYPGIGEFDVGVVVLCVYDQLGIMLVGQPRGVLLRW